MADWLGLFVLLLVSSPSEVRIGDWAKPDYVSSDSIYFNKVSNKGLSFHWEPIASWSGWLNHKSRGIMTQATHDVLDWESFGLQLGREAKQEELLRLPQQPSRRQPWILAALRSSTKGLKSAGAAVRALDRINKTLDLMQPGLEQTH